MEFTTKYFDLEAATWLTGVHLVLFAWSQFCELIGRLVGSVPFVPQLSPEIVSTIFFGTAIALPATVAYLTTIWRGFSDLTHVVMNIIASMLILWVAIISYWDTLQAPEVSVSEVWIERTITLEGFVDEHGEAIQLNVPLRAERTETRTGIRKYIGLPITFLLFTYSLYKFSLMRRGFVYIAGFFVFSEFLLSIREIGVADWICDVATETMPREELPSQCIGS